jgi:hypothetical protein
MRAFPGRVAGIPMRRSCRRVHFLHAAHGIRIAQAVLHFASGARNELPLVFGEHVGDGSGQPRFVPTPAHSVVAWLEDSASEHQSRTLYRTSWENP